ncbi:hypothetical protein Hanom_Chr05g00463641 [Helianthus anomalus]
MGNSKLKVNISRFASENASLFGNPNVQKDPIPAVEPPGKSQVNNKFRNEAFIKDGGGKLFSDLFSKGLAVVGRCKDLRALNNLFSLVSKAGVGEFSLSYLGGLSILIKFRKEGKCNKFVCSHSLWQDWFSSLDLWNGQSLPFERIAWLKVIGVPVHLAVNKVYDLIARNFGKIIHASQRSEKDLDLSSNCIGVLRGDGVLADWTPKCLEDEGLGSEKDMSPEVNQSSEFIMDDLENKKVVDNEQVLRNNFNDVLDEVHVDPTLHGEGHYHMGDLNSLKKDEVMGGTPRICV